MTSREDVNKLSSSSLRLIALARKDLEDLFFSLNLANPQQARDALMEIVPALVREYGDLAATVAAEWYEETRAAQVGGTFNARLGANASEEAIQGSVRYAAGHLWTPDQDQALAVISGAMQRHILYSGRDTVARNIGFDSANPRWGRVPSGAKTCTFCTMLASRGFVYLSERDAQKQGFGQLEDKYHDDCDCQVVAEFDAEQHHVEGYDPDRMYKQYMAARKESGSNDPYDVLKSMRRLFPDDFTDGVVVEESA